LQAGLIGYCDVRNPISVEIGNDQATRQILVAAGAAGIHHQRCLKRAIAIAEQDGNAPVTVGAASLIRYHKIWNPVRIDIRDRHRLRTGPSG
jgi:hypothetical protein